MADDSPHAQRMCERILRDEGHEVITVSDGAIAMLRTSGRGRCRWEPAALIVLAGISPVWTPLLDEYHPQDLVAVGLVLAGKTAGAIPAARPVLEALLRAGLYLPPDFVNEALTDFRPYNRTVADHLLKWIDGETDNNNTDALRSALSPLSPMPANFADQVTETEFNHLMAFLLTQRVSKQ